MAITKIHAIKSTVNRAIDYITDPNKTDGMLLVSSYNCEAMTAHLDFRMTSLLAEEIKGNYSKTGGANNKAYHLIQSFSDKDNLTPEEAHDIGKKLADELLEGKYEYIIATHIDTGHIHNHIVLNAVSFYDYKKFRTQPYKTAAKIRSISDRLCSENDLSVIKNRGRLGYSYKEHLERKKNTSWKSEIRKRLNYLLETETNYSEFKTKAAALGVEVNDTGKHIKYKFEGQQRYSRGNKLSDDDKYLKVEIKEKLEINSKVQSVVIKAIALEINTSKSYDDFVKSMKTNHGITVATNKKGLIVFSLNDMDSSVVSEESLGSQYSMNALMNVITSGSGMVHDPELKIDAVERFKNTTRTIVEHNQSKIRIDKQFIEKISVDGILINLPEDEMNKRIFIGNQNIDYDEVSKEYNMTIGSAFDFYYVDEIVNPDKLESNQLSGKFIKGENIIRSMELSNGTKPVLVDIDESNIASLSAKGISINLSEYGINRLFIENKYIKQDKMKGTCKVEIYNNWSYSFRNTESTNIFNNIKGSALIENLKENDITVSNSLSKRLMYVERKGKLKQTKELASALTLLRKNNVDSIEGINSKLSELKTMSKKVKVSIKDIEKRNNQYKEAAKYLVTYNKYLPIKLEYEKKSAIAKKGFFERNESELLAFDHADKNLNRLGINVNVNSEKVIQLVKNQVKQIEDMTKELKEVDKKIDGWTKAKYTIEDIVKEEKEEKEERQNNDITLDEH